MLTMLESRLLILSMCMSSLCNAVRIMAKLVLNQPRMADAKLTQT